MAGFGLLVVEIQGSVSLLVGRLLLQLGLLVLIPLVCGMLLGEKSPWCTDDRVKRLQARSQFLLYVVVGLLIFESREYMMAGFLEVLPWCAGLCAANLLVCFWLSKLSGFSTESAVTVSLEGSIRNLGVAILMAAKTLERMDIVVLPTVYFLSVLVFSILFAKYWRRIPGLA